MALFPISLGVRRSADAERPSKNSHLKSQLEKTLRRDDFCCRFCGFRAEQYQRVVPYKEAGNPPLATACSFCELCFALEQAGLTGAGTLIWLPEIGQAELHHIMRAVYIARAAKGELAAAASRTFEALMARRAEAKKRLGSDDPLLLATVMHESLTDEEYSNINARIEGIRLLPLDKRLVRTRKGDINQFPQMVKYWMSPEGPFAECPVGQWIELFKKVPPAGEQSGKQGN